MKKTLKNVVISFSLIGCTFSVAGSDAVPTVLTDTVKIVSEISPRRYVGMIESYARVDIVPRVTGTLLKMHFKEGEIVKKGDLLYELEDVTYKARVSALEAQKESLKAVLKFSETEFKRNTELLKSRAVSVTAFDKARMEIDSARANLKNIEANLIDAKNTLSYTKIYAPLAGRIGISAFSAGNLITPANGKLTDIEKISPIYVRFSISEKVFRQDFGTVGNLKKNAVVRIQLADGADFSETARVTLIDNKIDPSTNTLTLRAEFANKNAALIAGSLVTVKLSSAQQKKAAAVPPSALIASEKGYYVYVLDKNNKAVRRDVKTGRLADNLQIILQGIKSDDIVVVDGTHKVRHGMTVKAVKAAEVK